MNFTQNRHTLFKFWKIFFGYTICFILCTSIVASASFKISFFLLIFFLIIIISTFQCKRRPTYHIYRHHSSRLHQSRGYSSLDCSCGSHGQCCCSWGGSCWSWGSVADLGAVLHPGAVVDLGAVVVESLSIAGNPKDATGGELVQLW